MTSILDATVTSSIDLPHEEELPTCVRCKLDITTGHAYELGDDKWHTHCFSCYRCNKPLSCESDFLVLGTGTLICFDCSDSCKSCGKKIDDLAIILSSSNEAYCSGCFKCCKCGDKIKDLRYAKTKRGLFCLSCHERLLAKRKYYEEKKRRLTKHLPTIPKELQGETQQPEVTVPKSPKELKIPERSRNRPLSPVRKGSNSSNHKAHKRNISIDNMLKATVADDMNHTLSPVKKSNVDDSSLDNLSLEPLENLENEGIIDSIAPQSLVAASPLLADAGFQARTSSNSTSNSYKGGLLAEALNDPRSPTSESFGGLGITSASLSPGSIPDLGIRSIDGPLKIESAKSSSSIISEVKAQPTMKPAADIEPVQMYRTPALDFSNSSTNIRGDFLNTDRDIYNDDVTERKIDASTQQLHDLEKDVQMLRDIKQKLLDEISAIEERKTKLLQEVHELDHNRSNSVPIKTDSPHVKNNRVRPPPEVPFIKLAESPSPSKEQEHVASVARQAKPKFWKLFSSSSPPKASMMTKSSSSRNVSNLGASNKIDGKESLSGHVDKLKPFANNIMQNSGSSSSISSGAKIPGSSLYGSTLVHRCEFEQLRIPKVLTSCMDNIECDEENLKSEGLYRKSGSQAVIEQLEKQFAEGKDVNLAEYDINVSTGILKRYLRKLPDPVVTFQIYEPLIEVVRKNNMTTRFPIGKSGILAPQDIAPVADILNRLPKEHIYLLRVLIVHLEKVMRYKEYNLMGLNNISLVFAPGLIRDVSGEKDISDMKERNYIIAFILEQHKQLFK
ncbi:Unconventional myosin-IXb [Maudiozyma exigua]|uniref:Unconventional myosin-IXb n=1 Tax=Maudiozyma exigua TaxID=34358 RepID=A0A9P7B7S7_MAUEX|nr:Unconventional myosin-IXb [Kazachstania exigua]